jgi:hypothetical protein
MIQDEGKRECRGKPKEVKEESGSGAHQAEGRK